MTKIVINLRHGVFSLSLEAVQWMAERGHPDAAKELAGAKFYGFVCADHEKRSDPLLVEVVETLGEAASGSYAQLSVIEIPDDVEWQIENYDGSEWIAEKHRTWP